MEALHRLTVAQAAERIAAGQLSPVALVEALLERIRRLEPSLHAWVTVDEAGAVEAARRAEAELRERGPRGPLHGVPIGVKDIYATAGLRTTACSPILADYVPTSDATAVARLREAGAVILGKTVTTEFAAADPSPTRNPWDAACTPGGSSSGSAVAVAARMVPAALGSQTGGSVLRPAAYNGVVGFKPTYGLVSRYGVIPVAWTLDTMGWMTRTVEDAALLLQTLAGYDPRDPASARRPIADPVALLQGPSKPPRLGLVRDFFLEQAEPRVREHVLETVERLRQAGAEVREVSLPSSFALVHAAHRVVMATEAAAVHQEWFRTHAHQYGPKLRAMLEQGMLCSGVAYLQAQRHRRRIQRELRALLDNRDALLTPSTPTPAPRDLSTTGEPVFQAPWTFVGFPAITLPSGLDREGLPLGVQLVAAPFADARLLAVARWCATVLGGELYPPGLE